MTSDGFYGRGKTGKKEKWKTGEKDIPDKKITYSFLAFFASLR